MLEAVTPSRKNIPSLPESHQLPPPAADLRAPEASVPEPVPAGARTYPGGWRGLVDALTSLPQLWSAAILLGSILLIGWADRMSGFEVSLFVIYAAPIALSVTVFGSRAGWAAAMLCAAVWWVANRNANFYQTEGGYALATANRLFYFCVVAVAMSAVRKKHELDAARIEALEERRGLERELVRVAEYEQQRIGQDLHDGLCQRLAAIGCATRMLADDLELRKIPESQDASLIESAIQESITAARNLAKGLAPLHVDRDGLPTALQELARTLSRLTGANIVVEESISSLDLDPCALIHLYRIAQEALANAVKHSEASEIRTILQVNSNREFELRIEDNGTGLCPSGASHRSGMGLRTMRCRADAIGGELRIMPRPGRGTVVSCIVPLPSPPDCTTLDHEH